MCVCFFYNDDMILSANSLILFVPLSWISICVEGPSNVIYWNFNFPLRGVIEEVVDNQLKLFYYFWTHKENVTNTPLFQMVNTVTSDCAVRYETWQPKGLIPNQLLTPTGLQQFYYQRNSGRSSCASLWMFVLQALFWMNTNHVPFCHVCNHNANSFLDQPQRAVYSWLFQYNLSLSVSTSRIVNTFPDSECSR